MDRKTPDWIDRFQSALPTHESLSKHPWLAPVAAKLAAPELWRLQNEAVARGVAVGIFWAFVIPVGQIIAAAAHCVWWRANIPVAAAMTMLTNPLTIGFWLWLAYQLGAFFLGEPLMAAPASQADGVFAWILAFGWPTVFGMGIFAIGGSILGYVGVKLVSRLYSLAKKA